MDNIYILLDENDIVLNVINMPEEPVYPYMYESIKKSNNAHKVLKIFDGTESSNDSIAIVPKNTPSVGHTYLENKQIFLPQKPSEDHILDQTNTTWVLPFTKKTYDNSENLILNNELNYWDTV